MTIAEEIRALRRRPELLAPAGRFEVLKSVLAAGADAAYLGGKRFQMRAHRGDFHFSDDQLREAAQYVHAQGKRLYVTVNAILGAHELDDVRGFLSLLEEIGVDAAIVCDLATIRLAQELGVSYELHASTMMNVHDVDQAIALRELGLDRVVTSRDISIWEAGQLGERSGLAIEYFLHGDMCVAQSGQCSMSGLVFGKSSNRGECMKPCRWSYELIRLGEDAPGTPIKEGHLMALRDLSLLRQIPDLVEAGICALKIEGRMRDAAYLGGLVSLYREVLDQYCAMPSGFSLGAESISRLFKSRVRDLSALVCTGCSSNGTFFDYSGQREPLMLSNGAHEASVASPDFVAPDFEVVSEGVARMSCPELAVCVGSLAAARQALEAGADRIYLAAETSQFGDAQWTAESFRSAAQLVNELGAALGLRTPQVSTRRARAEWKGLTDLCRGRDLTYVLVHHFGALRRAQTDLPEATIIADYGFNILNSVAVDSLKEMGVGAVTPAVEAGFEDAQEIASSGSLPVELLAHGPITGMLLDHCLIMINLTKDGSKDVCRGPCKHAEFGIRDNVGETRSIITDQYCRNHILTAKDLAILPGLDAFLELAPASLRIEGQFYSPDLVGRLTAGYRAALDRWKAGAADAAPGAEAWRALLAGSPRPWNYGGYAQEVTHSRSTVEVMRQRG